MKHRNTVDIYVSEFQGVKSILPSFILPISIINITGITEPWDV